MFRIEHNVETGEITQIELTEEEMLEFEESSKQNLLRLEAIKQEAQAKAAAKAQLLEKLSITAEEAKLLLS